MSCDQKQETRSSQKILQSRMVVLLLIFAVSLTPFLAPAFAYQSRNEQLEVRAKSLVSEVFVSVVAGKLPEASASDNGRRFPRCRQEDIAEAINNPERGAQILSRCGLAPLVTGKPQYIGGKSQLWPLNSHGWTWTIQSKNQSVCERFIEAFNGLMRDLHSAILTEDDMPDHMVHFKVADVRISKSHYSVRLLRSVKEFSARCEAGSIVIRLVP